MTANVTIDNDFLSHLVEITGYSDLYTLIVDFFDAMKVSVEMHPFVYEYETQPYQSDLTKKLFTNEIIKISDFAIIKNSSAKKSYYETMVKQIYYEFTGKAFPCKDVCSEWKKRCSLGEVHTVVFSVMVGMDCFLSDDKEVSRCLGEIVQRIMSKPIEIKNRKECCAYIKGMPKECYNLKSKDFKVIAHKRTP